jgi:hypothetical protein
MQQTVETAGATYRDVKEQQFGGTRFLTRGLEMSMQKYVLEESQGTVMERSGRK